MTTSSTTFTPLFAIEKAACQSHTEQAVNANVIGFLTQMARRARHRLHIWNMRLDDRAFLADLHDYQLGDIGMTRDQRDREVRKPFWKE